MANLWKWRWGGKGNLIFFVLAVLAGVGAFFWLGQVHLDQKPPWIDLQPPGEVVGSKTAFTLEVGDKESGLKEVRVTIKQGPLEKVLLTRRFPPGGTPGEKMELPFILEPQALGFKEGPARITATVRDRSWREWFQGRTSTLTRQVVIDLVPLNLAVLSVNQRFHAGGTGVICYRLNKPVKESGVIIDGRFYQGFPQPGGPPGDYVALFALPRESSGTVSLEVVAKPEIGPPVKRQVSVKLQSRRWRQDKMKLSDDFLNRVAATFKVAQAVTPLDVYLEVNRNMRKANHERVRQVCSQSRPQPLWSGGFKRYVGKSMARFGDRRFYIYQGRQVDFQEHLGEDLASLVHSPVPATNNGVVVLAETLGIYGETVILDHGMGVFSMYSHLSQIEVKEGAEVKKGAILGKTGITGLAGGDHLHFSIIIHGEFVNPLEWWDARWVKAQVEGQWKQAGAPAAKAGKGKAKAKSRKRKRSRR